MFLGAAVSSVILVISIFIKIRLYKVHYFLGATQYLEIYIYEKRKGMHSDFSDIFLIDQYASMTFFKSKKYNRVFLKLILSEINNYNFQFNIFKIPFHYLLCLSFDFLTYFNLKKFIIPIHTHSFAKKFIRKNLNISNQALLINDVMKNKFEEKYKKFIGNYKVSKFNSLITYYNRDREYKKFQIKNKNWSYHDFRNYSPEVFESTINYFSKKNYLNCRVGNLTEKKLELKDSFFIDYSKSNYVSEELDIYLIYKSKFFIGTGSGLDKIASFFRIPMLCINSFNLSYLPHYFNKCIYIPNNYFDIEKNELISFKDQIDPNFKKDLTTGRNLSKYATSKEYIRNNVKIIYNTSNDIFDGAKEINLLADNELILDKKDIDYQNQFWEILKINKISKHFIISPSYLKRNLGLLK